VGVTDKQWYRFLAGRPGVTEVNFWQPSGAREFRVLDPGEPFLFKAHYPDNKVVGPRLPDLWRVIITPPCYRRWTVPGADLGG